METIPTPGKENQESAQTPPDNTLRESINVLTPRESAVLHLVVAEKTDKEIAQALNVAERTVRYNLRCICDKLGVNTRVGAAVQAVCLGLVEMERTDIA